MTKCSSISLSDDHRAALEANRACHGDEVLAWKRAQASILLDKNEDPEAICRMLNIDPTVLRNGSVLILLTVSRPLV